MASPQTEDGYTRIANELFDAILGFPFSARQMKVLLTLVRKIYGYQKKRDDISASQISQMCGVARNHVTSTLNELVGLNVIGKVPGTHGMLIEINKDYHSWIGLESKKDRAPASPRSGQVSQIRTSPESGHGASEINELAGSPESGLVPDQDATSPESGQVDSPESGHTKENLPKEITTTPLPPVPGGDVDGEEKAGTPKRERKPRIALKTFLDQCRANGVKPVTSYTPLMEYVDGIKLPGDFLALAWDVFCREHLPGGANAKRLQADWQKHFDNYVEKGYYRLWVCKPDGSFELTPTGRQAKQFHDNRRAA